MATGAPEEPSDQQTPDENPARSPETRAGRISILKKGRDVAPEEVEKLETARREFLLDAANNSFLEAQYLAKILLHLKKLEEDGKIIDPSQSDALRRLETAFSKRSKGAKTEIHDKSVEKIADKLVIKLVGHFERLEHDFEFKEIEQATTEGDLTTLKLETEIDAWRRDRRVEALRHSSFLNEGTQSDVKHFIPEQYKLAKPKKRDFVMKFKKSIRDLELKAVKEARSIATSVELLHLAQEKGFFVALKGDEDFQKMEKILQQRAAHYPAGGRGALDELTGLLQYIRPRAWIGHNQLTGELNQHFEDFDDADAKLR